MKKIVKEYKWFPSHVIKILVLFSEVKSYYTTYLQPVYSQPSDVGEVVPSLLHKNTTDYTAQLAWDNEWNLHGLGSRLSEDVNLAYTVNLA